MELRRTILLVLCCGIICGLEFHQCVINMPPISLEIQNFNRENFDISICVFSNNNEKMRARRAIDKFESKKLWRIRILTRKM